VIANVLSNSDPILLVLLVLLCITYVLVVYLLISFNKYKKDNKSKLECTLSRLKSLTLTCDSILSNHKKSTSCIIKKLDTLNENVSKEEMANLKILLLKQEDVTNEVLSLLHENIETFSTLKQIVQMNSEIVSKLTSHVITQEAKKLK